MESDKHDPMNMEQSQSLEPLPSSLFRFLGPSHRTIPEQLVGLGIYLVVVLLGGSVTHLSLPWAIYDLFLGLSMWSIWRKHSLRVLKLELSVFLTQLILSIGWSFSFFSLEKMLLSLVILLLLWSCTLLAALLFWKKERLSGGLLTLPFIWVMYLVGVNMMICISTS